MTDLVDVELAVTGCRSCGLCEHRTKTVFSRGTTPARLMVIGEAPGEEEDLSGKPFVGPSGRVLDKMLAAMGVEDVYICNTVKCRPPGNRRPLLSEIEECLPYLKEQISKVGPKVILLLGHVAHSALHGSDRYWLGRVRTFQGITTVSTYHPAFVLRNPESKKVVGRHLHIALSKL